MCRELKPSLRTLALFFLPASLLAASTFIAVSLMLVFLLCTSSRRHVPLATPVVGVLAAGLLAAVHALAADTLGARSAPVLTGPQGTVLMWFVVAGALFLIYANLSPEDYTVISLGYSMAALGGGGYALYQVALNGSSQATLLTFHPNLAAAGFIATIGGTALGFGRVWRQGWGPRLLIVGGMLSSLLGLLLTGSRSGILGATAGGLVLLILASLRVRWRPLLLAVFGVAVVGAGLWLIDGWRGTEVPNLLINSGFEDGLLPWALGNGSERVSVCQVCADDSGYAVLIRRNSTSWIPLATYLGVLGVPSDPTGMPTKATLSLAVRPGTPADSALELPPDMPTTGPSAANVPIPPLPVAIALDALDTDGAIVSRLGIEGWTSDPTDSIYSVGGRPQLPTEPAHEWKRYTLEVPGAPVAATNLRLEIQPVTSPSGTYGLIDNVMLAPASAGTAYIPGPRPGLFTFLAPATSRLQQLRQPFATSGGRVSMWLLGLDLAAAQPILGYGPGSERALTQEYAAERVRRPLQHFHSFYLRLLLEGGSVLLATVLVMIGYLLVGGVRGAIRGTPGSLALVATTVALLVQSIFDPVLAFGEVVAGLWLIFSVTGGSPVDVARQS